MSSDIVTAILQRIGIPELSEILTERLSASELNSLLLEVFHRKAEKILPAELLQAYQYNRFVAPVNFAWLPFLQQEIINLQFAQNQGYEPIELSPVSPLGTCSAVGTVHQHKVLTALRGTEMVADATNVLALESAVRRQQLLQQDKKSLDRVRLCTTHRHVRTATIKIKGFTPHFKIFCLTTAGRDEGNFQFEITNIIEHLQFHLLLLTEQYHIPLSQISFLFKNLHTDNKNRVFTAIHDIITKKFPEIHQEVQEIPQANANYYKHFQFKIFLHLNGNAFDIGDGGLVDWTQQLLGNRKERLVISGIGTEFLHRLLHDNAIKSRNQSA
ncbi:MAG: hypothetical protein ACK4TA_01385 [Saprospiraceae bacterium]